MIPFTYARAATPDDAVRQLASSGGAKLLAGGTTLYDLMKLGVEAPSAIVDINAMPGLAEVEIDPSGAVQFGALARMSDVAADPALARRYPALSESLSLAASQQLRNMASLGGNLLQRTRCAYFRGGAPYACNKRTPGSGCSAIAGIDRGHALLGGSERCIAVYPGDFAVALAAFDAEVELLGPQGRRSMALEALYREPGETPERDTAIAPDEMIVAIKVPATPYGAASTYLKVRDRQSYAFALASAAVVLELEDGAVRTARIALGGVATRPWRARDAEAFLIGQRLDRGSALEAGTIAFADARIGSHNAFRAELGRNAVADALLFAVERS